MNTDFYQLWFDTVYRNASEPVRGELQRLRMAPFASDPALSYARPMPLYVVSMKPYGDRRTIYPFGWEERQKRPGLHRWYDGDRADSGFARQADSLLRSALDLMATELHPRAVFNTYAYPFRAMDGHQLKKIGLEAVTNLSLHKNFALHLRPRLILCIGNGPEPSAFALYRRVFADPEITALNVAPRTRVKYFRSAGTLVLGIPHLSYTRAEIVLTDAVRRLIRSARSAPPPSTPPGN